MAWLGCPPGQSRAVQFGYTFTPSQLPPPEPELLELLELLEDELEPPELEELLEELELDEELLELDDELELPLNTPLPICCT